MEIPGIPSGDQPLQPSDAADDRAARQRSGTMRSAVAAAEAQAAARAQLARELGLDDLAPPRELRLRVDRDLDRVIARVVDGETGEVVREIPPEALVAAAKNLQDILGQMLNAEA